MSDALLAQAQQKVLAGDFAGAIGDLRRVATLSRRPAERAQALLTAGRLHLMLGEPDKTASLLAVAEPLATGTLVADARRLRAEWTDATGDRAARHAAWLSWLEVVDGALAISALRRLADLAKAEADLDGMQPWLDDAIERAHADPALGDAYVDALLERAAWHLNRAALDRAEADLAVIGARLTAEPSSVRARWTGLRGLVARARGAAGDALSLCLEARSLAVACRDVPSYVSATMLLVALHQEADRLVDAYDTLIRARESLRDLLGDQGAGLIQPALSAFEASMGDALDGIHAAWVARRTQSQS